MRLMSLAICMTAVMLAGCKPIEKAYNELMNGGELEGYAACMEYTKSEFISDNDAKIVCLNKFDRKVNNWVFNNDPGAGWTENNGQLFGFNFNVPPKGFVITSMAVEVGHFDDKGEVTKHQGEGLTWLSTSSKSTIYFSLTPGSMALHKAPWCKEGAETRKDCKYWRVLWARGLKL